MVRTLMIAAASAAILSLSPTAFAQGQFGTADEAKAMLTKAVAVVHFIARGSHQCRAFGARAPLRSIVPESS